MMGVVKPAHPKGLGMSNATLARPTLTTFNRFEGLGMDVRPDKFQPLK